MLSLFCTNSTKWEDPVLKTKNDSLMKKLKTSLFNAVFLFFSHILPNTPMMGSWPYLCDEELNSVFFLFAYEKQGFHK